MTEQHGEADLWLRAKAGDATAFELLLQPVLEPGYRLAMVMSRERPEAEDAVQEAALKAWRKIGGFREGADLRPWFLAIVANECRSARRARWASVLKFGNDFVEEPAALGSDDRLDLDAALARLPRRQLLPLALYYHLDLPIEEVGRVLGCSPGAARVRIHRALAALRPAMALEVRA